MDSSNLRSWEGHLANTEKIIYFNRVVKTKGMFSNVTKWRIRKGHASSRGYQASSFPLQIL